MNFLLNVVSLPYISAIKRYHDRRSQCRNFKCRIFSVLLVCLSDQTRRSPYLEVFRSRIRHAVLFAQQFYKHCRHVVQNEDKKDAHPPAHPQNSQRSNPISSLSYRYHAHHISPLPCTGRVGSVGRGQHVAITSSRFYGGPDKYI